MCPFSRKVRILLSEHKLDYELRYAAPWDVSEEIAKISPNCRIPILVDDGISVVGNIAIYEYIESKYGSNKFLGGYSVYSCAKVREVTEWFDSKMFLEVTRYIFNEKIRCAILKDRMPIGKNIRAALQNLNAHMSYIHYLLTINSWCAGSTITIADFSAASHLSILDYFGDIKWHKYELIKQWYSVIKSRHSFRLILDDRLQNIDPVVHYMELDF